MAFCRFGFSFSSGLLDKCGFAVFAALFWNVPSVIWQFVERMTLRTFSSTLYLAGKYSELLVPYSTVGLPIFKNYEYADIPVINEQECTKNRFDYERASV